MTNRKFKDYHRNKRYKDIVDANFKTFSTVVMALKQLYPHNWYTKTIEDFISSYADFTAEMNGYDDEAYHFRIDDYCRKLNISNDDTFRVIIRLHGRIDPTVFVPLQDNLKCMMIHLRRDCGLGSVRYSNLMEYLKTDADICGKSELEALGVTFDDDIKNYDYRKLKRKTQQASYSDGVKAQQAMQALKAYQDEVMKCQQLSSKLNRG